MTDTQTAEPIVTSDILHAPDPILEAPAPAITPAVDLVEEPVEAEPSAPLSSDDKMKAHIRAILAAQPFRGHAVHKDDLLAVIDALIDGPAHEDDPVEKLPEMAPFES